MQQIILWGPSSISEILEFYIQKENIPYNICAYTMDGKFIKENIHNGKPVVPFETIETLYSPNKYKMAIFMGYKNLNRLREEKYKQAKEKGYKFISYISKNSDCYTDDIGENVFILPHTNIQPFVKIGNNTIIWSETGLGHHVEIGNNCFLASPKIAGYTKVKNNCFLATNCSIADHLIIDDYSIVGIGSVVTKNLNVASVIVAKQTQKLSMTSFELEDIIN